MSRPYPSLYPWAAALCGLLATAATAQTAAPAVPAAPTEVADAIVQPGFVQQILLDRTDRMTLPVHIGGQGPFGFVVDTGAERSVISNELARRLNLDSAGRARVVGLAEVVIADMYHARDVRLPNMALGDSVVPSFSQYNIGGPGLIGIDSLEGHRLVIDFPANRMDILPSPPSRRVVREPEIDRDAIVVTGRRLAGRMILSNAQINGRRIDIILDTGAQSSVGNRALQRLVRREGGRRGASGIGQLTSVTGATLEVTVGTIERITVGGVDFTDLPIAYADSPAFSTLGLDRRPALLLGMDAMRLFERIVIDFTNRRVTFDLPDGAARIDMRRYAANQGPLVPGR
jgi:predicted aspartyl protease